ncbi:MAG: hypothetical protein V2I40_06805, partial [Desulfobacteraceae bacterium]|nr:hypothetical protein [Desulfobacteraceae bacterium]
MTTQSTFLFRHRSRLSGVFLLLIFFLYALIPGPAHAVSCVFDENGDLDIDGSDLAVFALAFSPDDLSGFAADFGHTDCTDELPPDPSTIAPAIDPTTATTVVMATAFLYTGDNPIQTGVAPGTIEEQRALVLRGAVFDRDGISLPGVRISVFSHPEFGRTLTREDGRFDMVVNGGGTLIVQYEKAGYLPVQRRVISPWQDYIQVPEVVLTPKDTATTTIDLSASAMQVARGSAISDDDGARQATLLIPAGTTAALVMPDGSTRPVNTLTVSATEYTVGDHGPAAMPAELPGQTGYTYCVELSAEEVPTAGADTLQFSPPVVQYVENFLGFPIGGIVPVGSYDRQKNVWSPSENGLVVNILGITGGMADLDVDGSGIPADPQTLSDLGITDAERERLAVLYTPGQSLWRISIPHFSIWDANWGWGPAPDAVPPILNLLAWLRDLFKDDCDPCNAEGSIIECQNQVLGETIDVAGTPFTLNYRSNRAPGRLADYTLDIPLSEASVPASLKRIDLEIEIAGQFHKQSFSPLPDQQVTFVWDGKDAYGRTLMGSQPVSIRVGYVYDGYYQEPADLKSAFGYRGNGVSLSVLAREEVTLWQAWESRLGPWDARSQGLGGWTLDVHHAYDPVGRILYPGYGGRRKTAGIEPVIDTVAGGGGDGCLDGCPALELGMDRPYGIALAPDGTVYIADTFRSRIRVFRPDGTAGTVAATESFSAPMDLALDGLGNLYVADYNNHRIVRVAPDGSAEDAAGTGVAGFSGDGGPAIDAQFRAPACIVVGPDGSLYVSDYGNHRIRRITPDGIVRTIAGTGTAGFSGDGGPAIEAQLNGPGGIDASPDGSLVFADENNKRIRRISPEGIITTVSGGGSRVFADGLQATDINMKVGWPIFSPDGSIYHTAVDHRVCRVAADGVITTVAGYRTGGGGGFSGDGGPATAADLSLPLGKALGYSRNLYIADRNNHRLREVSLPFPVFGNGAITIPSENGSQLHHFDADGRHIDTIHALTGALLYQFTYDENGLLAVIEDGNGNQTSIERDGDGNPLAIVAPFGQRTGLSVDPNGYLADIANPENETYHAAYSADGLMTTFRDPENHTSEFIYDPKGRLLKDENAAGGYSELDRVAEKNTYTVNLSTAENRTTTYRTEVLATGEMRKVNTFP